MKKKKLTEKRNKINRSRQHNLQKRIEKTIERKAIENENPREIQEIELAINSLTVIKNCLVEKNNGNIYLNLLLEDNVENNAALKAVRTCLIVNCNIEKMDNIKIKIAQM